MASLDSFMDAIVAERRPDRIWEATADFFAAHGFDRVIYTNIRAGSADIRTTLPASWTEHYEARRYERIDPFFRYCCTTLEPIGTGIDYLPDHDFLTAPERRLIQEASEAGLRSGFSCTFRPMSAEGVGGWNLGSSLSREEVEKLRKENQSTLRLAALYAHERLHPASQGSIELDLSPRQRECLLWIARGHRTKEIAERLDLKPVTVELHLKNARQKLGAQTREQAVAKAVLGGLLSA